MKPPLWLSGTYGFMTYSGAFSTCCLLTLLYIKTQQAKLGGIYQVLVYMPFDPALFLFFSFQAVLRNSLQTKQKQIDQHVVSCGGGL